MGDGEGDDIVVKGWARTAVVAVIGVALVVWGFMAAMDGRYVKTKEHEAHELNDEKEVARIDLTLLRHIEATRLDAVRLSVIEQQLATIQRQLEVMDGKLDRAALVRTARGVPR